MSERIHQRFPSSLKLPARIDFIALYHDMKGYRVYVSEFAVSGAEIIEVNFGTGVLAQRSMDEGKFLATTVIVNNNQGPVEPIVKVDKSDFLDWFQQESLGVYNDKEIQHIAILTQNEWIDVICTQLPEIRKFKAEAFPSAWSVP